MTRQVAGMFFFFNCALMKLCINISNSVQNNFQLLYCEHHLQSFSLTMTQCHHGEFLSFSIYLLHFGTTGIHISFSLTLLTAFPPAFFKIPFYWVWHPIFAGMFCSSVSFTSQKKFWAWLSGCLSTSWPEIPSWA